MRGFILIFVAVITAGIVGHADSAKDCSSPQPIFGKIIATCGDQMVTYTGDEQTKILGVDTTISRFELAYCSNGGGRKLLNLETNSEGWKFTYRDQYNNDPLKAEKYSIFRMWGAFKMVGVGYSGEEVKTDCQSYTDTRTDIKYIFQKSPVTGPYLPVQ